MPRLVNNMSADALTKMTVNSELFVWCFGGSAGESIRRDLETILDVRVQVISLLIATFRVQEFGWMLIAVKHNHARLSTTERWSVVPRPKRYLRSRKTKSTQIWIGEKGAARRWYTTA